MVCCNMFVKIISVRIAVEYRWFYPSSKLEGEWMPCVEAVFKQPRNYKFTCMLGPAHRSSELAEGLATLGVGAYVHYYYY